MPTITDWLMVGITAIYVIATIMICWANIKSASATRDQLAESTRQYEETKRLEIMPYIQFERSSGGADHQLSLVLGSGDKSCGKFILIIRVKNIGKGTAKDIKYTYEWDNYRQKYDRGAFPIQGIQSGEGENIKIDFSCFTDGKTSEDGQIACFILRYKDLLENFYTQKFEIQFKQEEPFLKLVDCITFPPCLTKEGEIHA